MARFFEPIMQAFDSSGNTIVGATLDFFEEGTTTPLDTFQDAAGMIPNANPVISGGGGLFPDIFLQSATYTVVFKDASGVEIWSTDVDGTEDPLVTEAIASAGITGTSDENLAEAIARYAATGGVFYEDNGAADAYVLEALGSFIAPKALLDGMEARFRPANANTGVSTVDVNSLGVKDIVNFDGTVLAGGELVVGEDITLFYDLANDRFKISVKDIPVVFTEEFESSEQTITSLGLLTIAHGLSAAPKFIAGFLICKVAERGYSVDDVTPAPIHMNIQDSANNHGVSITIDATNIEIKFAAQASVFFVIDHSAGTSQPLVNANWRYVVKAYL